MRSILQNRPHKAEERPHPLRSLLEAVPTLIDPLPLTELPAGPIPDAPSPDEATPLDPVESTPVEPVPAPEQEASQQPIRETVSSAKDTMSAGDDNVAGHDPTLLRRRNG